MNLEDARRLLDRIGTLRHPCDLDLLVFFARHPHTLITSEQLAAWLGYELKQIAESLELLLDGGLVRRSQNRTHAARLYAFVTGGPTGEWLPPLLEAASTRAGLLAMREALLNRASKNPGGPVAHRKRTSRPFVVRRKPDGIPGVKAG